MEYFLVQRPKKLRGRYVLVECCGPILKGYSRFTSPEVAKAVLVMAAEELRGTTLAILDTDRWEIVNPDGVGDLLGN